MSGSSEGYEENLGSEAPGSDADQGSSNDASESGSVEADD